MKGNKRKTSRKARAWFFAGLTLGGLSAIPFMWTFDYNVQTKDASGNIIRWGVGINNWGDKQYYDATAGVETVVNLKKDMYMKNGGGFFGTANYPTNYFKFHEYVDSCSKFDDKNAVYDTSALAQEVLDKSNQVLIFLYSGIALASLAGLMVIISFNTIYLRWRYKINNNNPTTEEVQSYYDSIDNDEETFYVNYRGN